MLKPTQHKNPPALNHSIHTSRANKTKSEDLFKKKTWPMVMAGWPSLSRCMYIFCMNLYINILIFLFSLFAHVYICLSIFFTNLRIHVLSVFYLLIYLYNLFVYCICLFICGSFLSCFLFKMRKSFSLPCGHVTEPIFFIKPQKRSRTSEICDVHIWVRLGF